MASTNQAPAPEPLFPLEPDPRPGETGDFPGPAPNVVSFKPPEKDADSPGSPGDLRRDKRAARHTARRANLPGTAVIPSGNDRYVSLTEAGEIYGVSAETLRRRISEGALPAVKGGYNLIRVLLSDVAKLFPPIPTVDPDDYARW